MPRLLWLFCLVNLVIGSGACVLGGILVSMARDLAISVPTAGQAITAHALSTAPLAPTVLRATERCWSAARPDGSVHLSWAEAPFVAAALVLLWLGLTLQLSTTADPRTA